MSSDQPEIYVDTDRINAGTPLLDDFTARLYSLASRVGDVANRAMAINRGSYSGDAYDEPAGPLFDSLGGGLQGAGQASDSATGNVGQTARIYTNGANQATDVSTQLLNGTAQP
jgi:hypothetical protein